jgi:predicted nucleic acid-binding protein
VKFWDSSALVPLILEEPHSKACRQLVRTDPTQLVFCFTRTEILSAIWRKRREGLLDATDVQAAEDRLDKLAEHWTEVDSVTPVRDAAEKLLRAHPLRAADSLQLGACVAIFGTHRRDREFVVLDDLLAEAARQEGFKVVVPRAR